MYKFGSNPELYKKLSEPRSQDETKTALEGFASEVAKLREKFGIPELLLIAASYQDEQGGQQIAASTLAMGNSSVHPEMAAALYDTFVVPLLQRADKLKPKLDGDGG